MSTQTEPLMTPTDTEVAAGVLALAPFFPPDTVIDPNAVEEGEYILASLEQIVEGILAAVEPLIRERLAQEVEALKMSTKPALNTRWTSAHNAAIRIAAGTVRGEPERPQVLTKQRGRRIVRGDAS